MKRNQLYWALHAPGWLLLIYLVYSQGIPAFDYEAGVAMGTQDSREQVTQVGVAFWKGFAIGDVAFYIPVLAAGLTGHLLNKNWGRTALAAALGVTAYWPIVAFASVIAAQGAPGWHVKVETAYWIVLPALSAWALWMLWELSRTDGRR